MLKKGSVVKCPNGHEIYETLRDIWRLDIEMLTFVSYTLLALVFCGTVMRSINTGLWPVLLAVCGFCLAILIIDWWERRR